jgi:uncharacterized protein YrrD
MLRSALMNRIVIDLHSAEELGRVTQILVDLSTHRVVGLGCRGGMRHRGGQHFLWSQVASVGRDGVVIQAAAPAPEADQMQQQAFPLANLELWSDHGDRIGQLTDFQFEPASGQILGYRFVTQGTVSLAPGLYQLAPDAVVSAGRRRMMVHDHALGLATRLAAGVQAPAPDPIPQREVFGYDIPDPRQGWDNALEGSRELREQLGGQVQKRSEQLRAETQERLGGLLGTVKKRTRRLRNQMRETVTDLTAGLPAGQRLDDDEVETIEVDSTELWRRDGDQRP